jgi:1-acyl-sn-glycerol-3-phosphate acyltransferase
MAERIETSAVAPAAPRGIVMTVWGAVATVLSILMTVVCAILAAIFAAMGAYHAITRLTRIWGRFIIAVCGVKVEIEGLENLAGLKTFILACNHQSFFDIFAVSAFIPGEPRFVAKKELLKIPVIGYALANSRHVVIDREAGGKEIRKAIETIRGGFNLTVCAEGHRFSDNRVHEFNDGAAWLAILLKQPVVAMSISGSGTIFPRGAKIVVPGRTMRMVIGKPISVEGMRSADRGALTARLEAEVRATFTTEVR